jgi:hypothetical protein
MITDRDNRKNVINDDFNSNKTIVDYFKNSGSEKFVCGKGLITRVNFINECDFSGININKRMDFMGSIRVS